MKIYVKPILIGLLGLGIIISGFLFVNKLYQDYKNKPADEPIFVETQIDFSTIYKDASNEALTTLYNGNYVETPSKAKYINDIIYLPIDLVIAYINDQFFYDANEKILTYTTNEDVIRMKTNELTYTVNDEPIKIDIGITEFDGMAYLPLPLIQKFSHHDYILNEAYHVLQIQDWYEEITTGEVFSMEKAYIRNIPDELSPYIHETFNGMKVIIIGEEGDYYKLVTEEGFTGFIKKEWVRSVITKYSMKQPVISYKPFPSSQFEGKINLVWHQVFNMTANQAVAEKFENVVDVDVISPTWFSLSGVEGDVSSIADINYVRWAHDQGYQVWALFGNLAEGYTKAMTHEVLSSTEKRMESIRQILALAALYELDGINIDFEAIPSEDGEYYVQYVKELTLYLKQQGLIVSADLPVPKSWTMHMDREEIAKYLDYVIIMGYDEHWGSSPISGSVASLGFVEEGVIETLKEVPKEKILLGVPFYTRLWTEKIIDGKVDVSSKAYGMDSGLALLKEKNVELVWDEIIGQYYGEYKEDDLLYRMWLEDTRSIEEKLKIAIKYDIAGVSGWKLGFESDAVWPIISDYMKP